MASIKTSSGLGPFATLLIGIAGTIASVVVTMQLKKMLEARGLPERSADLKVALKSAGASAADLKQAAAAWIADKASAAADSANTTAASTAAKVADVASTVKEQANG
jgi:hypothetical protein